MSEAHGTENEKTNSTEPGENVADKPKTATVGMVGESSTDSSWPQQLRPEPCESNIGAISIGSPGGTQEPTDNGSQGRPKSASSMSSTGSRTAARSTSSKFASLKAAFEPAGPGDSTNGKVKRRLIGSEKDGGRYSERKKQEYEAEVMRLKNDLEKEKELRVAFEERVTSLEEEIDELNSQLEERDEEHEDRFIQMKTEAETQLNSLANEARDQREEAGNLQRQLSDLKRNVSTSTRSSLQVSDTTFKQEFDVLQHEVQNWVVNNFRRAKVEDSYDELCEKLGRVTELKQHERIRPVFNGFEPRVKLPIFQATVACYLMEIFNEPFLYGLQGHRDWGERLAQAAEGLHVVLDARTYNRWRASTYDALRQTVGTRELIKDAASDIAKVICMTLTTITDTENSEIRLVSLKTIVHRAISTAHLIRVQQAQYYFILPAPGERFDATTMEVISDDADTDTECTVRCASFPGIIKVSDEDGDELNDKNVVVKAKVLCRDGET